MSSDIPFDGEELAVEDAEVIEDEDDGDDEGDEEGEREEEDDVEDENDVAETAVAYAADEIQVGDDDEEESMEGIDDTNENIDDGEEDELTVRSHLTEEETPGSNKAKMPIGSKKSPRKSVSSSVKKGRSPSVAGLTIPFRTVKKAMKLDPDTPIVQNEAAIMTTVAAELFLKSLTKESFRIAKNRGRNTVRYEDVAEARTNDPALAFLETLLP